MYGEWYHNEINNHLDLHRGTDKYILIGRYFIPLGCRPPLGSVLLGIPAPSGPGGSIVVS